MVPHASSQIWKRCHLTGVRTDQDRRVTSSTSMYQVQNLCDDLVSFSVFVVIWDFDLLQVLLFAAHVVYKSVTELLYNHPPTSWVCVSLSVCTCLDHVILEMPALPVMAGSNVTLSCRPRYDRYRVFSIDRESGRESFSAVHTIYNVQESDEGVYSCSVIYTDMVMTSGQSRLTVAGI